MRASILEIETVKQRQGTDSVAVKLAAMDSENEICVLILELRTRYALNRLV